MKFGKYIQARRLNRQLTLREFCLTNRIDPGLWSKLERGKISPPHCKAKLSEIAGFLGIRENSDQWHYFMNLAMSENTNENCYMSDEELVSKLPIFFRSKNEQNISNDTIDVIIKIIKEVDDDEEPNTHRDPRRYSHKE